MKAELKYTLCGLSHLNELTEISKRTFVEAFEKENNPLDFKNYIAQAFAMETLKKELCNKDTFFYFVSKDEKLIAYFKLNIGNAQTDLKLKESMELERIYVLLEFQGNGIGERMLQKVKEMAKEELKSFLWLGVWEKNVSAIKFYERHGFNKFGTHPYFIGKDKQTDWLMRFDFSTTTL